MKSQEPRSPGYYMDSRWLQAAVLFVLIGLLVMGLLWALSDAKARAEKQMLELVVRNMRTGMQLAMGEALIGQREGEIASWAGENPIRWLDQPPREYLGECSEEERKNLSGGQWCFEREMRDLVYRPHSGDRLQSSNEQDRRRCNELTWRVSRVPEALSRGGFVGLRIESTSPCQWVLERR